MPDEPTTRPDAPHRGAATPFPNASRAERLAVALRENLRRRKAQARERGDARPADGPPDGEG